MATNVGPTSPLQRRPQPPQTIPPAPSAPAVASGEQTGGRPIAWHERLTFKVWVFCFLLLLALNFFDTLRWLVRLLLPAAP
jgi:hypothetical protein